MIRQEIISELKKYFKIEEFVCKHCLNSFSRDIAWQFLDTEILHTVLVLRRDILKCSMICNDYSFGGKNTQRGLRCNICQIPKDKTILNKIYLSAHCNGSAFDFVFPPKTGMTSEKARQLIIDNQSLLPYNVRIEGKVSWLHIDCYDTGEKVHVF